MWCVFQLDAKKSPLALLAQTCSSIGKDPSPSKPIIPPLDKKDKEAADKSEQEKRPSSRGSKGSSGESGRDSSSKPGFRTVPPKDIPPLVPIGGEKATDSGNASSSSKSSSSDATSHSLSATSSSSASSSSSSHNILSSSSNSNNNSNNGNNRPVSATGSSSQRCTSRSGSARECNDYNSTPPASVGGSLTRHSASASPPGAKSSSGVPISHHSSLNSLPKPSVTHSSFLPGLPSAHPLAAAYPHLSLFPGLDPAVQSYHNALAAHSGLGSLSAVAAAQSSAAALKGAGGSALSPYVAYARVRTPSGATTLVPVCRDPYCTNCQLTLQNSHLSSACTAPGCSQCAHEKSLTSLTSGALAGLGGASLPIIPSISSAASLSTTMAGLSSLHSPLYPLAAHQGLGYVCSWVAGSEYCGKRFGNSEELLQHLRTHTSSAEASTLAAYGALGLHPSLAAAAAAAGCHSHYPGSPLSPNSLRRTYPTSLSPVSALLSANRYHPYKSPLATLPPPAPSGQGLQAVGPYYSPYSLYGQRLGAAAVP